jgi:hypothetical protein
MSLAQARDEAWPRYLAAVEGWAAARTQNGPLARRALGPAHLTVRQLH